jgi:DNA-binding NarL/FixJ family response regulator
VKRTYDADEILARMRDDRDSNWVEALTERLRDAPVVPEKGLSTYVRTNGNPQLTAAETRVLTAASHGLTNEMVAELLGISTQTVKTLLKLARLRLRAKSTTHACCVAIRQGLIR